MATDEIKANLSAQLIKLAQNEKEYDVAFVNMTQIDSSVTIPYTPYRYMDESGSEKKISLYMTDFIFETINKAEILIDTSRLSLDGLSEQQKKFTQAFYFISQNYAVKFRDVSFTEESKFSSVYDSKQTSFIISLLVCFVVPCSMILATIVLLMFIYASLYNRIVEAIELFRLLDPNVVETYISQCQEFTEKFLVAQKYDNWNQKMALAHDVDYEEYDEFDEIMRAKQQQDFIQMASHKIKDLVSNKFKGPHPPLEALQNSPGRLFSETSKRGPKIQNAEFPNETSERPIMPTNGLKRQSTVKASKTLSHRRQSRQYFNVNPQEEEDSSTKEKMVYKRTYIREVSKRIILAALLWLPLTLYTLYRDYANYRQHEAALAHLTSSLQVKISANYLNAFTYYYVLSGRPALEDPGIKVLTRPARHRSLRSRTGRTA